MASWGPGTVFPWFVSRLLSFPVVTPLMTLTLLLIPRRNKPLEEHMDSLLGPGCLLSRAVGELLAPQLACGSRPGCALPPLPPPHAHLGPSRLPPPILAISKHVAVMPIFKSSREKGGHTCPPTTGSHTPPFLSGPCVTSTGEAGGSVGQNFQRGKAEMLSLSTSLES